MSTNQNRTPELDSLLVAYINVSEDVGRESTFSFIYFLRLYWTFIKWGFSIYLLPITSIWNLFIYLSNKNAKNKRKYLKNQFFVLSKQMFKSLHNGEIPILKFFTARYIIKLIALIHIKTKLKSVLKYLQSQRLICDLNSQTLLDEKRIHNNYLVTKRTSQFFEKGIGIQFVVIIAPYLSIVVNLFISKKIDFEKIKLDETSFSSWFLLLTLLFYFLNFLFSCYLRKREIFLQRNIYQLENLFFNAIDQKKKKEVPWDIIGWLISMMMMILYPYFQFNFNDRQFLIESLYDSIPVFLIYFLPLLYALTRRIILKNR